MNRILRRPMFRTGGSAEGLTSGLQPRQGYAEPAGLVEQLQTKKSIIDTLAPIMGSYQMTQTPDPTALQTALGTMSVLGGVMGGGGGMPNWVNV